MYTMTSTIAGTPSTHAITYLPILRPPCVWWTRQAGYATCIPREIQERLARGLRLFTPTGAICRAGNMFNFSRSQENELGSYRRQLEAAEGQGEAAMGQADRRPARRDRRQARPARGQDPAGVRHLERRDREAAGRF